MRRARGRSVVARCAWSRARSGLGLSLGLSVVRARTLAATTTTVTFAASTAVAIAATSSAAAARSLLLLNLGDTIRKGAATAFAVLERTVLAPHTVAVLQPSIAVIL